MRKLIGFFILKTGLSLCNWLVPRMRVHPEISYSEYLEAVRLQTEFKKALSKLNK